MSAKRALKRLLWRASPPLYRFVQNLAPQEFAIGMLAGRTPFALRDVPSKPNPVLTRHDVTDVPAMFVADPFMCRHDGRWYLFFEVVNHLTRRGEIGLAESEDARSWRYRQIVLRERHHVSYPYVFAWRDEHYMIPETSRAAAVHVYRAIDFPTRWKRVATLLEGRRMADPSIFRYDDHWWLFTDAGQNSQSPVLRLYFARDPLGPWREHPLSPILQNHPHISRPAGRVIVVGDRPIRFAQDVYPIYGTRVYAFCIKNLSPDTYAEEAVSDRPVLCAGADAWNCDGMHHLDAHQETDGSWIACVDGFRANATWAAGDTPAFDVRADTT